MADRSLDTPVPSGQYEAHSLFSVPDVVDEVDVGRARTVRAGMAGGLGGGARGARGPRRPGGGGRHSPVWFLASVRAWLRALLAGPRQPQEQRATQKGPCSTVVVLCPPGSASSS
ncbi:hypothetical protein GCM10017779_14110 [Streptomyces capillispiralis]|nr:hypothetical protein GCM10017779_14110 [Streptomyces capillispiralis]